MKCISEETCKDGMCSVSAKCEPKTKSKRSGLKNPLRARLR
jgi:hypothetical protein